MVCRQKKNEKRDDKYVRIYVCVSFFVPKEMQLDENARMFAAAAAYLSHRKSMKGIEFLLLGMCWYDLTCCWIYYRYRPVTVSCC